MDLLSILKKLSLIVILAIILPLTVPAQSDDVQYLQKKDSLLRAIQSQEGTERLLTRNQLAEAVYFSEQSVDSLLKYYSLLEQDARKQNDIEKEVVARTNTIKTLSNRGEAKMVLERIQDDLDFLEKNEKWTFYYGLINEFAQAHLELKNNDKAVEVMTDAYNKAKAKGQEREMAIVLTLMGAVFTGELRSDRAIECYLESYAIENKFDDLSDNKLRVYYCITQFYILRKRLDEAEKYLKLWEADLIKNNIDIAKQPIPWSNYYSMCRKLYSEKGDFEKVIEYTNKMDKLNPHDKMSRYTNAYYKALAAMSLKKYDDALRYIETGYEITTELGDDRNNMEMRRIKTQILIHSGRKEEAIVWVDSTLAKTTAIFGKKIATQLDELKTQYDVDKKDFEIEKQKAAIDKRNLWLLVAIIVIIAAIAFIIVRVRHTRRLKQKNIGLAKQIKAQSELNKKIEEERLELEKLRLLLGDKLETSAEEEHDLLFEKLEKLMREQKPYTDLNLNRKAIADALGTNETYLRETIKKHYNLTVKEYINNQRLQYAKELLMQPSEKYTIEAIAFDSGFGSRSNFHAIFRDQYDLTPDEFRRFANER